MHLGAFQEDFEMKDLRHKCFHRTLKNKKKEKKRDIFRFFGVFYFGPSEGCY